MEWIGTWQSIMAVILPQIGSGHHCQAKSPILTLLNPTTSLLSLDTLDSGLFVQRKRIYIHATSRFLIRREPRL